jgi:hypothetical protein
MYPKQAESVMRKENCGMVKNIFKGSFCRVIDFLNNFRQPKQGQVIVILTDGRKSIKKLGLNDNLDSLLRHWLLFVLLLLTLLFMRGIAQAKNGSSLDIPVKGYGLSIGNSTKFTGLRINFRDRYVEQINGVNITLWSAKNNQSAVVNGLSIGVMPGAGELNGINLGIGVGAEERLFGLNVGVIGIGAGGDVMGINIGGIGGGAGGNMQGINFGLIGIGAGGDLTGLNIGGIGTGAGGNLKGISIGVIGVGSGKNVSGITIGGIGAGAGENMSGVGFGLIGVGAGENLTGVNVGGIGVGAGNTLTGVNVGGFGVGAPTVRGLSIGGIGVGGKDVKGVSLAVGTVKIDPDGQHTGVSVSAFNWNKGRQSGLSLGIVNYTFQLNGLQIGVINYVKENPKYLKILPVVNFHFD